MKYYHERYQKKCEGIPSFDFFEDYIWEESIGKVDGRIFWRFRFPNRHGAIVELKNGDFTIIELLYPLGGEEKGVPAYDGGYRRDWLYIDLLSVLARLKAIYISDRIA